MLGMKIQRDQVIRITASNGEVIRLRLLDRQRLGIEAPDAVTVDRFRVDRSKNWISLEALERLTGVQIGGRGADPASFAPRPSPTENESLNEDRIV